MLSEVFVLNCPHAGSLWAGGKGSHYAEGSAHSIVISQGEKQESDGRKGGSPLPWTDSGVYSCHRFLGFLLVAGESDVATCMLCVL